MNGWVIIALAIIGAVVIDKILSFIRDLAVDKHISDNLAILSAILETDIEEDEEETTEEEAK